jgi:hypothetical protein
LFSIDSLFCNIVTNPTSCNGNDGSAFVEVFGQGTDYEFLWSTGETTQEVSGLPVGAYAVTVTSSEGCETMCETFINQSQLEAYIEYQELDCVDGYIQYQLWGNVFGGNGVIEYIWSTGETDPTIIVDGVDEYYLLEAIDESGCSVSTEVVFEKPQTGIQGIVWLDKETGTQDIWDPGIDDPVAMSVVELYDDSDLVTPLLTSTTDINGIYKFEDLSPGFYKVKFTPAPGFSIVNMNIGTDEQLDSDADPSTGFTDSIFVEDCELTNFVSAGIKEN